MKAFLMYPDRDFDTGRDLPPNEADLSSDLELAVLLRAMAAGDKFLFDVARQGIHSGLASPAEIVYRQHVLADCIAQPGVVRDLYDVAVAAITAEKQVIGWIFRDSPDTILHRSRQVHASCTWTCSAGCGTSPTPAPPSFRSEGFTRFFAMLAAELDDDVLRRDRGPPRRAGVPPRHADQRRARQGQQGRRLRPAAAAGAELAGPHAGHEQVRLHLHHRRTGTRPACGRCRTWTSRGLNGTANALAQSADHIRTSSRCSAPNSASTSAA